MCHKYQCTEKGTVEVFPLVDTPSGVVVDRFDSVWMCEVHAREWIDKGVVVGASVDLPVDYQPIPF